MTFRDLNKKLPRDIKQLIQCMYFTCRVPKEKKEHNSIDFHSQRRCVNDSSVYTYNMQETSVDCSSPDIKLLSQRIKQKFLLHVLLTLRVVCLLLLLCHLMPPCCGFMRFLFSFYEQPQAAVVYILPH